MTATLKEEKQLANALGRQLSRFASIRLIPTWDGRGKDRFSAEFHDRSLFIAGSVRVGAHAALRSLNQKMKRALLRRMVSDKRFHAKWKLGRSE